MSIAARRQALRGEIALARETFARQSHELREQVRFVLIVRGAVRLARTVFALIRARRRKP